MKRTREWTLKQKISFFVSFIVVAVSIITLMVSVISSGYYSIRQSKEMAGNQLKILASGFCGTLKQYQNIAVALSINNDLQEYCKKKEIDIYDEQNVRNSLQNALDIQENLNYVVVIRNRDNSYIRAGQSDYGFETAYGKDYGESAPGKQGSNVRISFGNNYFQNRRRTLTLYHPIYRTTRIGEEMGMLVLNFADDLLQQLYDGNKIEMGNELLLIDKNGTILSSISRKDSQNKAHYIDYIRDKHGSFTKNGILVIYQKIEKWNYYLVNEISIFDLYKGTLVVGMILIASILFIIGISLLILRRIINAFYEPINRVLAGMDSVKKESLNFRIDEAGMDIDSFKLAAGFNSMMDKIEILMEQAKEEQHQMEQIRFNALQAQIKPHFLYNTLECIHWQAVVDKNEKISAIVKAMAQYYRGCLSKGREIISLKEELDHIHSYLLIQNMRYDNIVELVEEIPDEFLQVQIPKLTLQPLVENAIYHGIRIKEGTKGTIYLRVCRKGSDIYIYVANSGNGISQSQIDVMNSSVVEWDESFGYGLKNVNRRIYLMFGEKYGIHFEKNEYGGVTVEIRLPMGCEEC